VDTEQLIRLLRDSDGRYSTLSCEFAVRFYPEIAAKAERQQLEAGPIKLAGISPEEYFRGWDDLAGEVSGYRALVWTRRPDCYREQDFDEDEPTLLVRNGTTWWRDLAGQVSTGSTADGGHVATIGRYEMCVNPEPLPDRLDFEVVGAGERVGREVIRATALRLPPRPPVSSKTRIVPINLGSWFPLPVFSNGEDDYTVEIDAATGVILRIASVFKNQDWMVIEAVSAEFDKTLPADTFTGPADQPAEEEATKRRGWLRSRQ
jgi:hypothetical protein